jgi:diacylglycerol kinase
MSASGRWRSWWGQRSASPQEYHPLAKTAKDVAAAAVLIAASGSVFVGAALFVPRVWRLLLG